MSTGAEGPGRYSDETAETLDLIVPTKYYDVSASFLVAAEDEQKARAKVYNFVTGQSSDVDDWDVTDVEENTQWEI